MRHNHDTLVQDQFGPQAQAYVASAVHAAGADLDAIAEAVQRHGSRSVLDLGCGGGHVAYRVAPLVGSVVACDLSDAMLAEVLAEAGRRGLVAITTRRAAAEQLPFEDGSFDAVLSRFSAHHWGDLPKGLDEARRVLRPCGLLVMADAVAPDSVLADTVLQALELLRDVSHVRDYSVAEWERHIGAAGFGPVRTIRRRLRLDFASWIARMRTPETLVTAIRTLQAGLSDPVRRHFDLEPDGSFTLDTATFEAQVL